MQPSNPAFQGFDPNLFRTYIKSTMQMGAPNAKADQVTFHWTDKKTYSVSGNDGIPYDLNATPVQTVHKDDVIVDVAVEFAKQAMSETPFGAIHNASIIITVLDVDYKLIEGADTVYYGGNTYLINFVAPPLGLFSVNVYALHCSAVDET